MHSFVMHKPQQTHSHRRALILLIQLKGRRFSSDAEVIAAEETWLDGQPSDFFKVVLRMVRATGLSILSFVGSMLNKSRVCSL
jgi:hypothetical protein